VKDVSDQMVLENCTIIVAPPECLPSEVRVTATIEFDDDLSELLPYLNAEFGPCVFDADVPFLRFRKDEKLIVINPRTIGIAGLRDEEQAREVFAWLREAVNSVSRRKAEIEPSYWSLSRVKPLEVFKLLPRTNCGECGKSTCMALAAALASGEADPGDCPAMLDKKSAEKRNELLKLMNRK
jgi:ArsR family metal-binding transcriptional regulator